MTATTRGSVLALMLMSVVPASGRAQELVARAVPPEAASLDDTTPVLRLQMLEERIRGEPPSVELLVAAAEEGALLATSTADRESRKELIERARGYAQEAVCEDPSGVQAHYWLAATSGLLADEEGGRTKIRLADEAWRESKWVLEADPRHAGAHHIQGRLHAAVMRLNSVVRFLAKRVLGGDALDGASWESAEYHLRTAAELAPWQPAYHYELGVALLDLGRSTEARAALSAAASTIPSHPADERFSARAERLLAQLPGQ